MNESEYIDKLLMIREFIQQDAEDMREAIMQRENLLIKRIDKWIAQTESQVNERLIETFKESARDREGF